MALSPSGTLLSTVDSGMISCKSLKNCVDGRALLINYHRKIVLHRHHFKEPVNDLKFSPNGKWIVVSHHHHIQIWKCPGFTLDFSPFVLIKEIPGHYDEITHVSWSPDSRFLLTSSKDMTCRVYPLENVENFAGAVLSGHRDYVVGAWFSKDMNYIYTVSRDGAVFTWSCQDQEQPIQQLSKMDQNEMNQKVSNLEKKLSSEKTEKLYIQTWKSVSKNYFYQNHATVTSVDFHLESGLLSCGFSSGVFGIWEMLDFINIHTLR